MKKMCKILSLFLSTIIICCSCSMGFDKDAYLYSLKDLRGKMEESGIILANYGNYCSNYWKVRIDFDNNAPGAKDPATRDDIIEAANEWIADKSDETRESMDEAFEEIKQQYSELPSDVPNDENILEMKQKIDDLYNSYINLYEVVTDVSGTVKEYTSNVADCISELNDANNEALELLENDTQETE